MRGGVVVQRRPAFAEAKPLRLRAGRRRGHGVYRETHAPSGPEMIPKAASTSARAGFNQKIVDRKGSATGIECAGRVNSGKMTVLDGFFTLPVQPSAARGVRGSLINKIARPIRDSLMKIKLPANETIILGSND
jgi:hypothetical protein